MAAQMSLLGSIRSHSSYQRSAQGQFSFNSILYNTLHYTILHLSAPHYMNVQINVLQVAPNFGLLCANWKNHLLLIHLFMFLPTLCSLFKLLYEFSCTTLAEHDSCPHRKIQHFLVCFQKRCKNSHLLIFKHFIMSIFHKSKKNILKFFKHISYWHHHMDNTNT